MPARPSPPFAPLFGLLGLAAVVRFFAHGWIGELYIAPVYHFSYPGFAWLEPWSGWGMYAHFAALDLLSVGIAVGYRCRLCAGLSFVGFTYVELIDRTTYLNHYYWMSLVSLVSLLLALLPLHRQTVPHWAIWTLRAQVGVVYVFAGIAKLNPDWLLHALPLRIWLYQHGDLPLIGTLLQEAWVAYAMSWGGAFFDLTIVGWLLWRPSRLWGLRHLGHLPFDDVAPVPPVGHFPVADDWRRAYLFLPLIGPAVCSLSCLAAVPSVPMPGQMIIRLHPPVLPGQPAPQ